MGSRATLFGTPPGPAIQLATKPAFHLVIKSSLNPTEITLNLTDNPPNLTERARNQTERIAVSNAALIAKLIASKLLGSKEKDLLKLLNPPKLQDSAIIFSTPGMGGSAFYCANHRVSCKCQQPPGRKIHRFFRWKMPFAVFRSGSGISDPCSENTWKNQS